MGLLRPRARPPHRASGIQSQVLAAVSQAAPGIAFVSQDAANSAKTCSCFFWTFSFRLDISRLDNRPTTSRSPLFAGSRSALRRLLVARRESQSRGIAKFGTRTVTSANVSTARRIEPFDDAAGACPWAPTGQTRTWCRIPAGPAFVDTRNFRRRRQPRLSSDGERLDLPLRALAGRGTRHLVEHDIDLPGHQILNHLAGLCRDTAQAERRAPIVFWK